MHLGKRVPTLAFNTPHREISGTGTNARPKYSRALAPLGAAGDMTFKLMSGGQDAILLALLPLFVTEIRWRGDRSHNPDRPRNRVRMRKPKMRFVGRRCCPPSGPR